MDFAKMFKTPASFRIVHLEGNMMDLEEAPRTLNITDGYSIQRDADRVLIYVERSLIEPDEEKSFVSVQAEVMLDLLEGVAEYSESDEEVIHSFVSYARSDAQMRKVYICLSHAISNITVLANDVPIITPPMPLFESME